MYITRGFIKISVTSAVCWQRILAYQCAVLTLALAMAANTAIFSIAYRLLGNPLNMITVIACLFIFAKTQKCGSSDPGRW